MMTDAPTYPPYVKWQPTPLPEPEPAPDPPPEDCPCWPGCPVGSEDDAAEDSDE